MVNRRSRVVRSFASAMRPRVAITAAAGFALYAAIDIHKHAFQAAVLDAESDEVSRRGSSVDRVSFARWAEEWRGRVSAVAIGATTGSLGLA